MLNLSRLDAFQCFDQFRFDFEQFLSIPKIQDGRHKMNLAPFDVIMTPYDAK